MTVFIKKHDSLHEELLIGLWFGHALRLVTFFLHLALLFFTRAFFTALSLCTCPRILDLYETFQILANRMLEVFSIFLFFMLKLVLCFLSWDKQTVVVAFINSGMECSTGFIA